jgi:transcriptional regulator GlxA family with amidase domain
VPGNRRGGLYVRDGRLYTSAGATAGLDCVLALVEEDFGRRIALAVAQWLVVFLKRDRLAWRQARPRL